MPTNEQLLQALSQVIDPELGNNIVDLGMVRDIKIEAGDVTVTLALTIAGCPMKSYLKEQIQAAAFSLPDVENVSVEMISMTDHERSELKDRLSPALHLNQIGQFIAVMSGKGGVGKSSVTALLASALRRKGYSVGILDGDLTGPSIPRLFGIHGPVGSLPLGILPVETRTGIKIISTNLMLEQEDMAVIWRGPIMSGTIKQFWKDVLWGRVDYLLIDLPPGTSDATLTVMQSLPIKGVVLVTLPQGLSSMIVRKTVHMSQQLNVPILGIVENMSYFVSPETGTHHEIFGPSQTAQVVDLANAPLLGRLPIDPSMTRLADAGDIESYTSPACDALLDAFEQAVPYLEPAPAAPWLQPDKLTP